MPLLETTGSSSALAYGFNSFGGPIKNAVVSTFNSFGVVDGQTKSTSYTSYTGASPSGTKATQYTRMTSNATGRPGGLTYTDIVLDGEFFICWFSSHSSDGYNAAWLYDESYATFSHTQLGSGGTNHDYGAAARYGFYIQNSIMDIWDGVGQPEGSGGNAGTPSVPGYATSGYIGMRRDANGKFYTYWSASAPGSAGYSAMTLIHGPSVTTFTGRVRLGMFIHDANEYLEVYSPGTYINKYPNFVSDHSKADWTPATYSSGNRSFGSGNYFASETSTSYKYTLSSYDTGVNRPQNFWADGIVYQNSYYRVNGGSPQSDSFEFYFANKEVTPTNISFYMYPIDDYRLTSAAWQRWNGSGWTTVAGIGDYASSTNWTVSTPGPLIDSANYTTPPRNAASFTFNGTQTQAYDFRSKYWRLWAPGTASLLVGTDDVWHSNGAGPLNFWTFA
jgi:hypothetical protein